MNVDFALILVVLTLVTGVIWGLDTWLFRQKRRDRAVQKHQDPAVEPVLVEYSRSLFPVLLIVLLFRSFLFEPFKIPSGSMIPTLLVGDFIVVNKFDFGLRLPVLNTKVVSVGEPQRGDVVVFRYPVDPSINFIKRVIGLPGDTITYRDKQLYINGKLVPEDQGRPWTAEDVKCTVPARDSVLVHETLDGRKHEILLHDSYRSRDGQWVVPPGHYFMMGDNRDRSNDSRFWGFVPEENLVGKAVGVWLNFDLDQGCPDWSRIGHSIE